MLRTLLVLLACSLGIPLYATDYYWVGGAGNWSDINHWATTSGGSVKHILIPTANDNVYFDANSVSVPGQWVTVNAQTAACKSLDCSGLTQMVTFDLSAYSTNLKIYGSLILNPWMIIYAGSNGQLSMEATTSGNIITTKKVQLPNINFTGSGGWQLTDSLLAGRLSVPGSGNLNFSGKYIKVSDINCNGSAQVLNITGSSLYTGSAYIFINSANFISANSLITFDNGMGTSIVSTNTLTFNRVIFISSANISSNSSFSYLEFRNNSTVNSSCTIDSLVLTKGKRYIFYKGRTQTITGTIVANGNCKAPIYIESDANGYNTTFKKTSGNITIDYCSLRDISVTGGVVFTVNNAVDRGNNSGLTLNIAATKNLYWVGGSGNWDDPLHWALSSGGAGNTCVPTEVDNVFFDQNSFTGSSKTVTISSSIAVCKSMDWTGALFNPTFSSPSITNELHIYGSLTFIQNMQQSIFSLVSFDSRDTNNTIQTGYNKFIYNVTFNGIGGSWRLLDSFQAFNNNINLNNGYLHSMGQFMSARNLLVDTGAWLNLYSSLVKIGYTVDLNNQSSRFNSGTSTIWYADSTTLCNLIGNNHRFYNVLSDCMELTINSTNSTFNKVTLNSNVVVKDACTYDTLLIRGGKYARISNQQKVNSFFDASTTCNAPVSLMSFTRGTQAVFSVTTDTLIVNYFSIIDINATGTAKYIANQSVDLGNNSGWKINAVTPRNLFWVGGTGNWNDPAHWSLNSGGSGGACIPTAVDDVFLDSNSFTAFGQSIIFNISYPVCHNMNWSGIKYPISPIKATLTKAIQIYGSLTLSPKINASNWGPVIAFESNMNGNTITSRGINLNCDIEFNGTGKWNLTDSLQTNGNISIYTGTLTTNNYLVKAQSLFIYSISKLSAGTSDIRLKSWFYNYSVQNNTDSCLIQFDNDGTFYTYSSGNRYHNVIFLSNGNVSGAGSTFSKMHIYGNGTFNNSNTFDTLIFSPGKTYQLIATTTQNVLNNFNARGNNCAPIYIKSSYMAYINKVSGNVTCDFLELTNIIAKGGAVFYAGKFSTKLGVTSGWIFDNASGYAFGLGADTSLCGSLILRTDNFNYANSFLWNNSSTADTLVITQSGTYWCTAFYGASCKFTDTIQVLISGIPPFKISIDSPVCNGKVLSMHASFTAGINYTWHGPASFTSSSANPLITPVFGVNTGNYFVIADSAGCLGYSDTLLVQVEPTHYDSINGSACQGYPFTLPSGKKVTVAGVYSDTLLNVKGCDSIVVANIQFMEKPENGNNIDTSVCGNQIDLWYENRTPLITEWYRNKNDSNPFHTGDTMQVTLTKDSLLYYVCYRLPASGCTSDKMPVLLREKFERGRALIPNVFTPDNDGKNDLFSIYPMDSYEDVKLTIYNRWGNLMFSGSEGNLLWNGSDAANGVYYYIIRFRDCKQQTKEVSGSITLIR